MKSFTLSALRWAAIAGSAVALAWAVTQWEAPTGAVRADEDVKRGTAWGGIAAAPLATPLLLPLLNRLRD
jgi:hypothetical protein